MNMKSSNQSDYDDIKLRMMLKIVLYDYKQSVFSGRKIEKLLNDNIRMMWLS